MTPAPQEPNPDDVREALEAADGDDGWADVDPSDYEVDDRDREAWRRRSDEST